MQPKIYLRSLMIAVVMVAVTQVFVPASRYRLPSLLIAVAAVAIAAGIGMALNRRSLMGLMIAVGLIAIALGIGMALKRRSDHYHRIFVEHSREALRLGDQMRLAPNEAAITRLLRLAHWQNCVAAEYANIASCPWLFDDVDPASVACQDSSCGGRYRGGVITDDQPIKPASP